MEDTTLADTNGGHWARISETGTYGGLRFLFWMYKHLGRSFFKLFVCPAMVYFFLCRREAREASVEYLAALYATHPEALPQKPTWRTSFNHFLTFGDCLLDKVIAWSGEGSMENLNFDDPHNHTDYLKTKSGLLLIGSHLGNLEFTRALVGQHGLITINVLTHDSHTANFTRLIQRINPASQVNLFQVTELDVAMVLALKQRIEQGEIVVIAGDRIPVSGSRHTVAVDFLGKSAALPIGPYILAATLACPVVLLFAYRQNKPGNNRILLRAESFADKIELKRPQREKQLQNYAQQYADRLAYACAQAPLQWFNFYPFWGQPGAQKSSVEGEA